MAIIFLFIDGVGLGEAHDSNPFYSHSFDAFERLAGFQPFSSGSAPVNGSNQLFKGIDATLDVGGLPQSGTGQATLFTGINAAKKIGRHFGPFPHSEIRPDLRNKSLFFKAKKRGKRCYFMNAYPEIYFEKADKRNRWSCTTLMTRSAGIELNTISEIQNGRAVTAGITQRTWREKLNLDVPEIPPAKAAERILNMAEEVDLLLYEYYLTDKAGHSENMNRAVEVLSTYNEFLNTIISGIDRSDTLILTSDHGNVEDLSTKTHTYNKVPLFVQGANAGIFESAKSIQDITPLILQAIK